MAESTKHLPRLQSGGFEGIWWSMAKVENKRGIIDRKALEARLAALATAAGDSSTLRASLLETLKEVLAAGRDEVKRRFDAGASGTNVVHANCYLIDQIVRGLHEFVETRVFPTANPTAGERMSLVAVGGYGRGELAPFSDVDLLFLVPYKRTPRGEQVIEYILYLLWDLGLKVGHATRSIDECLRQANSDHTILTSLLESRYLSGDAELYAGLRKRFLDEVVGSKGIAFVDAKLNERKERHAKLGDSRYVLEPNVKEGKGGLRDLHTLFWIGKFFYRVDAVDDLVERGVLMRKEADDFAKAQNFLWTLRCHLHYLTGRDEERLTFDLQPEIGRLMGYTDHAGSIGVERFMKHYYLTAKEVGDLTRIFCAAIESETKRPTRFSLRGFVMRHVLPDGFGLEGGRLSVTRETVFEEAPINLLRLFHLAQAQDLDIHPHALRLVTRSLRLIDQTLREDPEANRLFLEMLTSEKKDPEEALRRLNEAGVLGRFIPDFGRVVAQMQHDMYHVYTVDEHTIRAIGILHRIDEGSAADEHPISSAVIRKVHSRRVLYVATMLHDIAKGRGGDHSVLGAEVAMKLGPRLGLTEEETETAAWLVRHHLLMSYTAQRRDIHDAKTVTDFADTVQSAERLRQLLVLTVVDMRATGPAVWNGWKAALLRELYFSAEDHISGGVLAERRQARIRNAQEALRRVLPEWTDSEFAEYLGLGYPDYWLGLDTATHARHALMLRRAAAGKKPIAIETRVDRARAVTEVTIYTADHPGLFSVIAGAIAVAGGNIVDAKIFTMTNGMALDTFWVQDALTFGQETGGVPFEGAERLAALEAAILRALAGGRRLRQELARKTHQLPSRTHVFKVAPRVIVDNKASTTHTVIEVNGRDRPGLLFDLTRTLSGLGLQISSAKIATYGEKVVDVFYVKDVFGLKVENKSKIQSINDSLLSVLAEPAPKEEGAASAAAAAS
ncbi:MAG: [protein-PII] uridylyltransferase [Alphaproteobacteria bacterium]